MKFLLYAHYTPLFILNESMWSYNYFQGGFSFLKVALVTSIVPSLEIPSFSWISTWSMRISWPRTCPRILPSSFVSQVRKKFRNKSSFGVVHCKLNRLSKPSCLAHLSLLESIFIHCNIFWFSFTLDIGFFLTSFSTCSSTSTLPFHFIIILVPNLGRWGIMLEIGPSLKNYWRNSFPLLIGCYSFFSSTCLHVGISYSCS